MTTDKLYNELKLSIAKLSGLVWVVMSWFGLVKINEE